MKKTYVAVAVALLAVFTVFGVSSEAKTMTFKDLKFSIDVADGWKVEEDKENYTVGFTAPDDSAALTVSSFENEDKMPLQEIAEALRGELNGKNLTQAEDAYMFEFENEHGVACQGIVAGDEWILFLSIIGEHADIGKMIDSLEGID
ncbi:MAG: hypothetical protein FWG71_06860 [Synergistaceae bacterium]|nr:hypothetical protein [Synergistaceae bacterium]